MDDSCAIAALFLACIFTSLKGKTFVRFSGGLTSALFRLGSYLFLRWIPGRFASIPIPTFFLLALLAHYFNSAYLSARAKQRSSRRLALENEPSSSTSTTSPSSTTDRVTPKSGAVPSHPDAPSFAEVAALNTANEKTPLIPPIADEPSKPSYATVAAVHTTNEKPGDAAVVEDALAGESKSARRRKMRKKQSANSLAAKARAEREAIESSASSLSDHDEDEEEEDLDGGGEYVNGQPLYKKKTGSLSLSGLVFGTPSSSRTLNWFSLAVNTLLLAAVMDSLWTPVVSMHEHDLTFVRVGAVDHGSAKILARIPPQANFLRANDVRASPALNMTAFSGQPTDPVVVPVGAGAGAGAGAGVRADGLLDDEKEGLGARIAYRPTKPMLGKWIMGPAVDVSEERDWTGVAVLNGLYASTEYEYRLLLPSLTHSHHPSFPKTYTFTTFPDPALSLPSHSSVGGVGPGTHFTFAASSCVKPGFPYSGPWSKKNVPGAKYLLEKVDELGIKFVMFLGDMIYIDTPYYAGPYLEQYYKKYRQVISSPAMKALFEKVPFVTIWDDHEIYNDYSAASDRDIFPVASRAFYDYFGATNPAPADPGAHYYTYQYGDAAFFVMDARTYRSSNTDVDDERKTMLGARQKEVFLDWLGKVNQTVTFKFVVSSTPFMTLWSLGDDTWAGFQTEREELLDVMQYVPNVIVLSGDRHEFAAASIRTTVTEFSTSPLSAFYLPIRTLSQNHGRGSDGEDVLLKYLPDGNSKFSTFEVDTRVANKPVVRVRVIIDGDEAWSVDVQGKQLEIPPPPTTVGSLGKSLFELLGFKTKLVLKGEFVAVLRQ